MLIQWTPFREMARLQGDFDRWLGVNGEKVHGFTPPVDVVEDEAKFELHADLPGVTQEDLDIQIEKDVLTIRGERVDYRRRPASEEPGKLTRKGERVAGAFSRAFTLPKTVDVEKIAASLKDGVLTLTLPKRPEAQPRQIKIAVNA